MSDKPEKTPEPKKSLLETVREVNERERKAELEREALAAQKRAERARIQREEYEKNLAKERLALMKLKSGVITEDELETEKPPEKVYTKKEKISNFFYHNKTAVIVSVFIAVFAVYLIHDMATKVHPDVSVMIIAGDPHFLNLEENAAAVFERYCNDLNGDGEVSVRVSYLPAIDEENIDPYISQANQTRLAAEFQMGDTIMVITDLETIYTIGIHEGVLSDLREMYPNDENVTQFGYSLNATSFFEDIGYPVKPEAELFVCFRQPRAGLGTSVEKFAKNYDDALTLWNNYLNDNGAK